MSEYLRWLRSRVGHDEVVLAFGACILTDDAGNVVLQQRRDSRLWGFPGGLVERGEDIRAAVRREVLEETGFDALHLRLLGVYGGHRETYPNGDRATTITIVYMGQAGPRATKSVDTTETLKAEAFKVEDAPELFNQAHQEAWRDYLALESGRR